MSLHIKTFIVPVDDGTLFADLQLVRDKDGVRPRVRIHRNYKRRKGEHFIGFAGLNKAAELVNRPEDVSEKDAEAIEKAIQELLVVE